jgi:SAM-dependent methyltransferase
MDLLHLDKIKRVLKTLPLFKTANLGRRLRGRENSQEKILRGWGQEKILAYLLQRYGTNRKYTELFLDHMLRNHKDSPQFDLYVDAELGSLNRSREFIKSLCKKFGSPRLFSGKACLDIGSSAGNTLIAFTEYGASRATGIEISPQRFQTALVNIQECPQETRGKIQMWQDDIQNEEITRLGQFDVIFCSDVLEHVANPSLAIKQICSLLKDTAEAFAYVKLRNFQHPQSVRHEPHYDFPGMVLLPQERAQAYFDLYRPDPKLDYEVQHWMSFSAYQDFFHSSGKVCGYFGGIHPDPSSLNHIEQEANLVAVEFDRFCKARHLDSALAKEIRYQIDLYLEKLKARITNCRSSGSKQLLEEFFLEYVIYEIIMLISNPESKQYSKS